LTNDAEQVERAYQLLTDDMESYKAGAFKRWYCMGCGIIVGILLAVPLQVALPFLVYAKYDRSGLDNVAKEKFGDMTFDDV